MYVTFACFLPLKSAPLEFVGERNSLTREDDFSFGDGSSEVHSFATRVLAKSVEHAVVFTSDNFVTASYSGLKAAVWLLLFPICERSAYTDRRLAL